MRKFLSTAINQSATSFALFLLRLSTAVLMIPHGYEKLAHFADMKAKFMSFMGLGSAVSLALVIFAEFFCSLMLAAGMLARFVLIPLIIDMAVAVFKAHKGQIFDPVGQTAFLFLNIFVFLLITGSGKISVDNPLFKNRR
jgi:putative oxidoreductase